MDSIMLINILAALIISTWYMASYQKRAVKMVEFIFKKINSNEINEANVIENIHNTQIRITATTWLIIISGIILTLGFTALFIFQSKSSCFSPYMQSFISSGLYIPIFLFVIGRMIILPYKVYTKISNNYSLSQQEMNIVILIISVIINIALIIFDWQLGLFVVAIILGKFIWIDFKFDLKELFSIVRQIFKDDDKIRVEFLCVEYAKQFYPALFVPTIAYQLLIKDFPDTPNKLYCMVAIYIADISICASSLNGMDRANASFIKNLK